MAHISSEAEGNVVYRMKGWKVSTYRRVEAPRHSSREVLTRLFLDALHVLVRFLVHVLLRVAEEHVDDSDNGAEGVAELVAHEGEELALGVAGHLALVQAPLSELGHQIDAFLQALKLPRVGVLNVNLLPRVLLEQMHHLALIAEEFKFKFEQEKERINAKVSSSAFDRKGAID